MALWGKTDVIGSIPKYVTLANYAPGTRIVFVDATEAAIAGNKSRGLSSPGWWIFKSYTDNNGQVRYKTEQLVALSSSNTAVAAGDNNADDDILKDIVLVFTTQPANTSVASGATATFTAVVNPNTGVTYQWQQSTDAGVTYVNTTDGGGQSGSTTASLTVTTGAPYNGRKYRLVVTKTAGDASTVTSNVATLTVT